MSVPAILLAAWMTSACLWMGQSSPPFDPHGVWVVKKVVAYSDITGLDEAGARKLAGKKMVLGPDNSFAFDHLEVQHIKLKSTQWKANNDFYLAFRVGSDDLGFKPDREFTVIDAGMTQIIPRDANHIIFEWQGVWLAAARQAPRGNSPGAARAMQPGSPLPER